MIVDLNVLLVLAASPMLASFTTLVVAVLLDQRANRKLDEIHTLTNSTLTQANKRIDILEKVVLSMGGSII